MSPMVVFFQIYSPWDVLLALHRVARATRVVFYHPCPQGDSPLPEWSRRVATWLARAMNPSIQIEEVDQERLYRLGLYQSNFESDRYVEELFVGVSQSASFRIVSELVGDPHVERFFKIRLVNAVLQRTAFWTAVPHVLGGALEGTVVPAGGDYYEIGRRFLAPKDYARLVPFPIRAAQTIRNRFMSAATAITARNVLLLGLLPFGYLAGLIVRRGISRGNEPIRADVVMPLIWGFSENGLIRGRKSFDNGYLVGDGLSFDRMLFYFSEWPFDTEKKRAQLRIMADRGIRSCDPNEFVPPLDYVAEVAAFGLQVWREACRRPLLLLDEPWIAQTAAACLYQFLKQKLFCRLVDYKVGLEYQDYSSQHVIRTIVADQSGRLTVGIHHSEPDGPHMLPVIRYTHVHRHGIWGEKFKRLHAPYWDSLRTVPIGAPRVDYVIHAQREERRRELETVYRERYGGQRPLVLLLFPGLSTLNIPQRIAALIEGLGRLGEVSGNFRIVCRFKAAGHQEVFRRKGLAEIMARDERIVVDLTDLTTFEWMAISDVVVVNSASTGMIEAAAAGKPCFSFDYQMIGEIVYGRYGSDLILRTSEDLVRVVRQSPDGFRGWNCRWDQLAKDYCYFTDGRNLDRFRQMILDGVAAVDRKRTGREKETEWEKESSL